MSGPYYFATLERAKAGFPVPATVVRSTVSTVGELMEEAAPKLQITAAPCDLSLYRIPSPAGRAPSVEQCQAACKLQNHISIAVELADAETLPAKSWYLLVVAGGESCPFRVRERLCPLAPLKPPHHLLSIFHGLQVPQVGLLPLHRPLPPPSQVSSSSNRPFTPDVSLFSCLPCLFYALQGQLQPRAAQAER